MQSTILFKVEKAALANLTEDEKKILPLLVKAAKIAGDIFDLQANEKYSGANFYPHGISKDEIEKAAEENPEITSPHTIVEKNEYDQLVATPFHQKYKKPLKEIQALLLNASKIAKNISFKKYLQTLAQSLLDGSYEKSDIAWLKVKNSNLDISIGPYERRMDQLMLVKRSYQAHVGIIDRQKTQEAIHIREILIKNLGTGRHTIQKSPQEIQEQHDVIFAGLLANDFLVVQRLPRDPKFIEKYGSKLINHLTSTDIKFEKLLYPIFELIFEKNFKDRYSKDLLRIGMNYHLVLYSVAKELHGFYLNESLGLKELGPILEHENNMVSGIQHAKYLVLKGIIEQKELESLMVNLICWIFSEWTLAGTAKYREDFLKGDAMCLNFLIRERALQEKDGISWPNFAKMFFEIENLSTFFSRVLEEKNYEAAKKFQEEYLSFEAFRAFSPKLAKIKPLLTT